MQNFIMQTGRDTNRSFLPLQTEVFGDYNPTGYVYLLIPLIKIFGFNIFSTRFVDAFFGSLAVFAVYFLVVSLFQNKTLALLSAGLFAFSPWDIVLSRSSEQAGLAVFFTVFGFGLLIYSIRKENIQYLILSCVFLLLSYFMYFTPRLFVPLLYLSFFIYWKYWWKKRKELFTRLFILSFIILSVFSAVLVLGTSGGTNRFNQVSIFGFPSTRLISEEQIREDGVMNNSIAVTRIFHNKILAYSYTFISNYLQYFSPEFLFMAGGYPVWLRVPQMGLIYLIELPFILIGVYRLSRENKPWAFILVLWLLIAPVVSALTTDDIPNVRRALNMAPVFEIIAAYGIYQTFKVIKSRNKYILAAALSILYIFSVSYFIHAYFTHSVIHENWYRSEVFENLISKVNKVYKDYDHIIVSKNIDGNYSEILFFMNYDPGSYFKDGAGKDTAYTGFGKFYFVPGECPVTNLDTKIPQGKNLFIENGVCKNKKLRTRQEYIYRLDHTAAYHLVYGI